MLLTRGAHRSAAFFCHKRVTREQRGYLPDDYCDAAVLSGGVLQNKLTVPIEHKLALTITEAAEYSNIGQNKIDRLLKAPNCPFVLFVGTKKLVKRKEFEKFISQMTSV